MEAIFSNDNDVKVLLPYHRNSYKFCKRNEHEISFRRIHTYLINNKIIDTKKNFIDLGAWIGDNTIPWAMNISGVVYAIDPSPFNCAYIKNVKELNNIENVIIIEKVIADCDKTVYSKGDINHTSFLLPLEKLSEDPDDTNIIKLNATSLDKLFHSHIVENIGYIHLDVEGMEFLVIKGAIHTICHFRPIVSFEQHIQEDDYMACVNFFHKLQYVTYMITEILPGCRQDCRNFLSIPIEKQPTGFADSINKYFNLEVIKLINTKKL